MEGVFTHKLAQQGHRVLSDEPPRALNRRFGTVSIPGSAWMLASAALFTAMLAAFKLVGAQVPVPQVLFLRQVVVLLVLLPGLARGAPGSLAALRSRSPGIQVLRSVLSGAAMLAGFTAVVHLPLTETTTIAFTRVVFAVILGAILLGERVGYRRWSAAAVGFAGVVVVANPGLSGEFNPYVLLSLLAAALAGTVTVILRRLATRDAPATIMFWHSAILLALLAGPAWLTWIWPSPREWLLMAVMGLLMAATQWTSIRALQASEASALAPIEYTRLLWAALAGWMLFDHAPTSNIWAGAILVLVAAGLAK